jgi:uncharacterized caspase-like protein
MKSLAALIGVLFCLGAVADKAHAQRRLALLIGNQAYNAKVGPLKNPHNDTATVGRALEAAGFKITVLKDANRREVLSGVKTFAEQLAQEGSNAIGFFYYSGHGISRPEDRTNYLVPVDLKDTESSDFWFDAVKLDDILGELERAAPSAAHFVVFDACRNELKLPVKSAARLGFTPVTERAGMYIAFATAPGAVASDQGTASGPYASVLAAELRKPGQDHLQLFQNVKEGVYSTTGNRQVPWATDGLLKRIYLSGEFPMIRPPSVAPARPQAPEVSEASREWARVDKTNVAELETFLRRHVSSPEADYARARLDEVKKQASLAKVPAPASASPPVNSDATHECSQQEDYERRFRACTELIRQNPKNALAYRYRGFAYAKRGDDNKAIADYTKAIEFDPNSVRAYNNRGSVYRRQGDYIKALADYTKAIEINPNYAIAYRNRARVYETLGRNREAAADTRKAHAIEPSSRSSSDVTDR